MVKDVSLGLEEALRLTMKEISPLPRENVGLARSIGRVGASDLYALVDSPSMDASLKDGYAVSCRDVERATNADPVRLRILHSVAAGAEERACVEPGTAVRVLTGARIPTGADAVIAQEFVGCEGASIVVETPVEPGTNILPRGSDVALREPVLRSGKRITPGLAGLLAAGGHAAVPVFRNPIVGIVGTGDEIVEPGKPLGEGKLYASNVTTLAGWCHTYKMKTRVVVVRDDRDAISSALGKLSEETDAVLTSGGAWTGDRDMVVQVLEALGWRKVFHRIRMGPGKAVGFGILNRKPLFVLPGGPPSNLVGFLQIACPDSLLSPVAHTPACL